MNIHLFPRIRLRTRTIPYQGRGKVESSVRWLSTGTVEYGLKSVRFGEKFRERGVHKRREPSVIFFFD